MSQTDYRDALRLLNTALDAVKKRHGAQPVRLGRRLRAISLRLDLLRARLQQPSVSLRRN